tara:strand:+ start:902 stop:1207 length:306 start_codon:yes stop_codon:yes gene_type:complete
MWNRRGVESKGGGVSMSKVQTLIVELPDGFALVGTSPDDIVSTLAGLDWELPNEKEEYMKFVSHRYALTGNALLYWDSLSFLEACHDAKILILTEGGENNE